MKVYEYNAFKNKTAEERDSWLQRLYSEDNPRQKQIYTNLKYYDGKHWSINEQGKSNTTQSGKVIWGKFMTSGALTANTQDPYLREPGNAQGQIAFEKGILQVHNLIKQFIQIYQDHLFGNSNEEFNIAVKDVGNRDASTEAAGEQNEGEDNPDDFTASLQELWFKNTNVFDLLKNILAKGIVSTVFPAQLVYSDRLKGYRVESANPAHLFPIYEHNTVVGYIKTYDINASEAKNVFGIDTKTAKKCSYAEVYIKDGDNIAYTKLVKGHPVIINDANQYVKTTYENATQVLLDEYAFLPFDLQPNINHAARSFNDDQLEDSEIFGWIDKQDALNAHLTLAFLGNMYTVFPRSKVDFESAEKMGIDPSSGEFKAHLQSFTPSPFSIDSVPYTVEPSKNIDPGFYEHLDRLKNSMFQEASIPEFIINGTGISAVSERTMQLALDGLVKKITQKREGLARLIKEVSVKYLKVKHNMEFHQSDIVVEFPDVLPVTKEELSNILYGAIDRSVLPIRYVQRKILEITNNEEDIAEVKALSQEALTEIRAAVEERRRTVLAEQEAERQLQQGQQAETELAEVESRIQLLQQ